MDLVQRLMGWLTWLGVVPFVISLASAAWQQPLLGNSGIRVFIFYSVVICCFMAGTLWGQAIYGENRAHSLIKALSSNAIALCVCAALLVALDDQQMLIILSLGFLCALAIECLYTRPLTGRVKPYLTMRAAVTMAVLFLNALAYAILP